jgi:hypothetical protein
VLPYRAPSWSWAVTDESLLFEKSVGSGNHPLGLKLIEHDITLRDTCNPYGEVTAASITVRGLTLPFAYSTQQVNGQLSRYYSGWVYFDDEPLMDDRTFEAYIVDEADTAYILAVAPMNNWVNGKRVPQVDLEIDHGCFEADEYLALMVHVEGDEDSDSFGNDATGLIIKAVVGQSNKESLTFERVGIFRFRNLRASRPENWESKVLKLI